MLLVLSQLVNEVDIGHTTAKGSSACWAHYRVFVLQCKWYIHSQNFIRLLRDLCQLHSQAVIPITL